MTPERLLELYDEFSDAPGAVKRMRRFVLDLAVRGRLSSQSATDSSYSAGDIESMITHSTKILKKRGLDGNGHLSSTLFKAIPSHWYRLPLIAIFQYDAGEKYDPQNLLPHMWLLELEDIEKDTGRILKVANVSKREPLSSKAKFEPGDVLYGKLRPYLNKVVVAEKVGYCTTEIVALRPNCPLNPSFASIVLRSSDFVQYVTILGQGTKMPRLRTDDAIRAMFPLPPLGEQERIVAKVDELMGLCDELEGTQRRKINTARKFVTSVCDVVRTKGTKVLDESRWSELVDKTILLGQSSDVKALTLNVAVQGKFSKTKDVTNEKVKDKLGDWRTVAEPQLIPSHWRWVRLEEIATIGTGSTPLRANPEYWEGGEIPWINSGATSKPVISEASEFVTPQAATAHRLRIYPKGCLVIALYGQGKTRGQVSELGIDSTVNQACATVVLSDEQIATYSYLKLILEKQYDEIRSFAAGGPQPNLNVKKIKDILVPLPPRAQQDQLVEGVNVIKGLCHELESAQQNLQSLKRLLLESVLSAALKPSI